MALALQDVLFYSLPDHAHYYSEVLNLMEESAGGAGAAGGSGTHGTVTVLFSKWDVLQLERVVGSARAKKMLSAESSTFMFC